MKYNNNINIIGLRGSVVLPLVEARKKILMVMYKYLLDTRISKDFQMIKRQKDEEGKKIIIVCEGNENGERAEDENEIFGAAGMLKHFLLQ